MNKWIDYDIWYFKGERQSRPCPDCNGTGFISEREEYCNTCDGEGYIVWGVDEIADERYHQEKEGRLC